MLLQQVTLIAFFFTYVMKNLIAYRCFSARILQFLL